MKCLQKMNVLVRPEVFEYLFELIRILYEEEYFGFEADAIDYVNELLDDIQTTLPKRVHKLAPEYFSKYGKDMEYARFPRNKRTTWYAFFNTYKDKEKVIYWYVTYQIITRSHNI